MNPAELLARAAPPPSSAVVVALSGGPDSAVAAWVATQLAVGAVRAIHIDHGTASSPELATAAELVAAQLGIPFEAVAVEVGAGASWEAQARTARWEALRAKAGSAEVIATGHHSDDLAETTLGNLVRGAGAAGLAAFAVERRDVWRPLLNSSRSEVLEVADELELPYLEDPTNRDTAFFRNKLRHVVIPHVEEELGPVRASLLRTAHALAADDATLESEVADWPLKEDAWGAWSIPAPLVATGDVSHAARAVRRLLRAARPPYAGTAAEVTAGLEVVAGAIARAEVAGGIHLELEGPLLVAHRGVVSSPQSAECAVPGQAAFGAMQVAVKGAAPRLVRRSSLLSPAAIGDSLLVRSANPGEKLEIAAGSKPIRDVMAEAGIPVRLRSAWPVAEAHGRIAAVAGIRSAPWARGALDDESTVELTVRERQL